MKVLQLQAGFCMCVACLLGLLFGCANSVSGLVEIAPESPIKFVDLDKFDQQLERHLKNKFTPIAIEFYGKVSINNLPDRLQNWLLLIDNHGQGIEIIARSENVKKGSLGFMLSILPQARAFFLHNRRIELIQSYSASIELLPQSDVIDQMVLRLPLDQAVQ